VRKTATLSVPPELWREISDDLLSTPALERAAIGFAGIAGSGSDVRLFLRDWCSVAPEEYQVQLSNHMEVDPSFYARAGKRARASGEALVIMHSHPRDPMQPHFSGSDDFGEDRLIPKIQARVGVPVAAVVIAPGGLSARFTSESGKKGELAVDRLLHFDGKTVTSDSQRFDRQIRALGSEGQFRLAQLRIGVVGAGGIGSHVIEQLLHLGVGHVIAVDMDRVDISNLSRLVGASRFDVLRRRRKVDVFERMTRRLKSGSRYSAVFESVTNSKGTTPLLQCDVVIGCTDNHWSRMVLNTLAYQYHVPVIDCGVEIQPGGASGGRVSWLYPGMPCLWCLDILDAERIRVEQLPDATRLDEVRRGYVRGLDEPAPAVVSVNGVIASLAVTELIARVTAFAGEPQSRPGNLMYRIRDGVVRRIAATSRPECLVCGRHGVQGAGDLASRPWTI
jgi:molybdopterin/thiamine biosynthesis adenylyltransferase